MGSGTGILIPRMQAEGRDADALLTLVVLSQPSASYIQEHPETPSSSSQRRGTLLPMITFIPKAPGKVTCLHISFLLGLSQACYQGILFPLHGQDNEGLNPM